MIQKSTCHNNRLGSYPRDVFEAWIPTSNPDDPSVYILRDILSSKANAHNSRENFKMCAVIADMVWCSNYRDFSFLQCHQCNFPFR